MPAWAAVRVVRGVKTVDAVPVSRFHAMPYGAGDYLSSGRRVDDMINRWAWGGATLDDAWRAGPT